MQKWVVLVFLCLFVLSGCTAASSTYKSDIDDDAPFDRLDTDRSGWITQEEWDNFYGPDRTKVFYNLDTDRNRRIGRDEHEAGQR